MKPSVNFEDRIRACLDRISPAERRVARYFLQNREEVLISSAFVLAQKTSTSDATVVRTTKALGFTGMEELRRTLVEELRGDMSPAGRMVRTLREVGRDAQSILDTTLDIHQNSLENLRRDITPERFQGAVDHITAARRVFSFGLGPSSAMADYVAVQLGRFGIDSESLTQAGILLADGIHKLKPGDLLMIFAYGRVYRELSVLLDQAKRTGVNTLLFSDTLGTKLKTRVDLVLPVARGRSDMLSMHTATLALIEAILVGVASRHPKETIAKLDELNRVRSALAGKAMDLPTQKPGG